jgi:hypothetical protein
MESVPRLLDSVTSSAPPADWAVDALLIGGGTAALLLAEHAILWEDPQRVPRPAAYALGTGTLGMGMLIWALRHRDQAALIAWIAAVLIAAPGGAAIITAYYWRHIDRERRFAAQRGGHLNGRMDGHLNAVRLENDEHHRRTPLSDRGRRNTGGAD